MQTGERQASVNPDYEKRSWLTLGLFACFKTSKMESSITATPPSCQWKGEKGIISGRAFCMFSDSNLYKFVLWVFSKFIITIFCYAQGPLLVWLHKLPMPKSCTCSLCPSWLSLLYFFFAVIPVYQIFKGVRAPTFWQGEFVLQWRSTWPMSCAFFIGI